MRKYQVYYDRLNRVLHTPGDNHRMALMKLRASAITAEIAALEFLDQWSDDEWERSIVRRIELLEKDLMEVED